MRDHLIIPDTQVKPGVPLDHLYALSNLIMEHKPDVIVHLGDHWDMPSLSSYDEGKTAMENRRYAKDVEAGDDAMKILTDPIAADETYNPKMVFCIGNHEERITRFAEAHPKLENYISIHDLYLDDWEIYDYLEIAEIDGVSYSHYFANPFSGRPWGGSIQNRLNKVKYSFTQGHVQKFEHGCEYLSNGEVVNGLVAGAFYMHDEVYKGPQGNHHFRGVIYKTNVADGDYDFEVVRLCTLLQEYGE